MSVPLRVRHADSVVMMEDHDRAYYAWKERGVRGRALVHVDAHIDFGWVPEMDLDEIGAAGSSLNDLLLKKPLLNPFLKPRSRMVHIGNYICPAIRDGIVNKFYWVVPGKSLGSRQGRGHIVQQLRRLLRTQPPSRRALAIRGRDIRCRILGIELIVCTLESLEHIPEPVLLDIDVDFMLTDRIWDDLDPRRSPWIFPEQVHEIMAQKISAIDVLTIAYSVEGGFTPLKFKYLGDEMRSLFTGTRLPGTELKRNALALERKQQWRQARDTYLQAVRADALDASAHYNCALLLLNGSPDEVSEAAAHYSEAVRLDRSYATSYNNYGILYLQYNKLSRAETEYRRFLRINAHDPFALGGLGMIALIRKRYDAAGSLFDQCLAVDPGYAEARIGKAIVRYRQGLLDEARELFSCIHRDLPDDAQVCWWLARIAHKQGDISSAIRHYKGAVMRSGEGPLVHVLLAGLYMQKRFFSRAIEELQRSCDVMRALS